jgi:hypothetical protein
MCTPRNKKTLRVDLTRIIIDSTRRTVQLATQRADLTRKVYFYLHAFVSNQKSVWLNENKNKKKSQKPKHDPGPVDLMYMCIKMLVSVIITHIPVKIPLCI